MRVLAQFQVSNTTSNLSCHTFPPFLPPSLPPSHTHTLTPFLPLLGLSLPTAPQVIRGGGVRKNADNFFDFDLEQPSYDIIVSGEESTDFSWSDLGSLTSGDTGMVWHDTLLVSSQVLRQCDDAFDEAMAPPKRVDKNGKRLKVTYVPVCCTRTLYPYVD